MASAALLDTTVCKKLFAALEGNVDFSSSRMVWSRFVSPGADKLALLIARCEKIEERSEPHLQAQLCLVPLKGFSSSKTMWTSELSARALKEQFETLAVVRQDEESVENMTNNFARTLGTKDDFVVEEQSETSMSLIMDVEFEEGVRSRGSIPFRLTAAGLDDYVVGLLLDMAFALLDPSERKSKHTEYLLSKEKAEPTGWMQTLAAEDTPLANQKRKAEEEKELTSKSRSSLSGLELEAGPPRPKRQLARRLGSRRKGNAFAPTPKP